MEKKDFLSGKISKAIKVEENGKPLEKVENDNINLNGDNKSTERSESESNGNEIDSFEKLTSLKKLFDSGVLNESEYNEKKEILLEELQMGKKEKLDKLLKLKESGITSDYGDATADEIKSESYKGTEKSFAINALF